MPVFGPTYGAASVLLQTGIISAIKNRARSEYGDYEEMVIEDITLDGTTRRVDLADDVIEPTGLVVTLNGTPLTQGVDYILDYRGGIIALTTLPPANATLSVTGTNYQFYTDEELDDYLNSALLKHTHQRVVSGRSIDINGFVAYSHMQQTLATLPEIEYQPLSLLMAIEVLWTLAGDASYDINVQTADGTGLPRLQRYQAIMNQIQSITERYKDLCWQIGGVGFWRIHDGGKLRRVSLFTGRLIPLRAPRELDDGAYPARILTPIDVPTGTLVNANQIPAQEYDPVAEAGNPWSATIQIGGVNLVTVPGYSVLATITAGSRLSALVAIPAVIVDDTHVTLSLTGLMTAALPPYAPWRLSVIFPDGTSVPAVAGTFLVEYPS